MILGLKVGSCELKMLKCDPCERPGGREIEGVLRAAHPSLYIFRDCPQEFFALNRVPPLYWHFLKVS